MSNVKQKFTAIINDLATLEVATFTKQTATNVPVAMDFGADGNTNTDAIFAGIRNALDQEELVGYARFEIDGDTVAFVNNNEAYADVLDYHKEMIEAGQNTRKGLYDAVVGLFSKD